MRAAPTATSCELVGAGSSSTKQPAALQRALMPRMFNRACEVHDELLSILPCGQQHATARNIRRQLAAAPQVAEGSEQPHRGQRNVASSRTPPTKLHRAPMRPAARRSLSLAGSDIKLRVAGLSLGNNIPLEWATSS
ncbi:hypothetical protein Dimus_027025 [Dionaea muscipula]